MVASYLINFGLLFPKKINGAEIIYPTYDPHNACVIDLFDENNAMGWSRNGNPGSRQTVFLKRNAD